MEKKGLLHQGDWLRRSVAESGESISAFARRARVSRDAVNKWFTQDRLQIRIDSVVRVLEALGYNVQELMGDPLFQPKLPPDLSKAGSVLSTIQEHYHTSTLIARAMSPLHGGHQRTRAGRPLTPRVNKGFDGNVAPYSERKVPSEIPTFDLALAAGAWTDISGVGEVCDPRAIDHGFFRVRLRGDSMTPKYKDGDLIEFRCLREGRDTLEVGKDYYIQRDSEATFKRLVKVEEERLTFRAVNRRKHPKPFVVARGEVRRMAQAVAKVEQL